MKPVHYGDIADERPGLIGADGLLRDLSDHVTGGHPAFGAATSKRCSHR